MDPNHHFLNHDQTRNSLIRQTLFYHKSIAECGGLRVSQEFHFERRKMPWVGHLAHMHFRSRFFEAAIVQVLRLESADPARQTVVWLACGAYFRWMKGKVYIYIWMQKTHHTTYQTCRCCSFPSTECLTFIDKKPMKQSKHVRTSFGIFGSVVDDDPTWLSYFWIPGLTGGHLRRLAFVELGSGLVARSMGTLWYQPLQWGMMGYYLRYSVKMCMMGTINGMNIYT